MTTVVHHTTIVTGERDPSVHFNAAVAIENDLSWRSVRLTRSWRVFQTERAPMDGVSWSCPASPTVIRTSLESLPVGSPRIKAPLTGLLSLAKGGFRFRR